MGQVLSFIIVILSSAYPAQALRDQDDEHVIFYSTYGREALRLRPVPNSAHLVQFEICDLGVQLPGLIDNCKLLTSPNFNTDTTDRLIRDLMAVVEQEVQQQTPQFASYIGWPLASTSFSLATTTLLWWPPKWIFKNIPSQVPDLRKSMRVMGAFSALGLAVDLYRMSVGIRAYSLDSRTVKDPARSLEQTLLEYGVPKHALKQVAPPISTEVISRFTSALSNARPK